MPSPTPPLVSCATYDGDKDGCEEESLCTWSSADDTSPTKAKKAKLEDVPEDRRCLCGATNCRGVLGDREEFVLKALANADTGGADEWAPGPKKRPRRTVAPGHRRPELARSDAEERAEPVEIILRVNEVDTRDHLRAQLLLVGQGAIMVGMGLGDDDAFQRAGAVGREQPLVARAIAEEAGIDQQVAIARRHQIGVGNILHHEDAIGDRLRLGLALSGHDKRAQRRLRFLG